MPRSTGITLKLWESCVILPSTSTCSTTCLETLQVFSLKKKNKTQENCCKIYQVLKDEIWKRRLMISVSFHFHVIHYFGKNRNKVYARASAREVENKRTVIAVWFFSLAYLSQKFYIIAL